MGFLEGIVAKRGVGLDHAKLIRRVNRYAGLVVGASRFIPSKCGKKAAATQFFTRAFEANGLLRKIVFDESGANTAGVNSSSFNENCDRTGWTAKTYCDPMRSQFMGIQCDQLRIL